MFTLKAFCIVATTGFTVIPAHSTLVVFQWTPNRILLSADSLSAKVRDNQVAGIIRCKIHQEGDIFFTIVGINDDSTLKIDLVTIAMQAARANGSIERKIAAFDKLATEPIFRLLRDSIARRLTDLDVSIEKISVLFLSRKEHAIAMKEYVRNQDGSVGDEPDKVYGVGLGRIQTTDYVGVGVLAEAQTAVDREPTLSKKEGIPFVVGFIEAQIAHERDRLRRQHKIPRVGGPISILQIVNHRAAWVRDHQKPCPDIKR